MDADIRSALIAATVGVPGLALSIYTLIRQVQRERRFDEAQSTAAVQADVTARARRETRTSGSGDRQHTFTHHGLFIDNRGPAPARNVNVRLAETAPDPAGRHPPALGLSTALPLTFLDHGSSLRVGEVMWSYGGDLRVEVVLTWEDGSGSNEKVLPLAYE